MYVGTFAFINNAFNNYKIYIIYNNLIFKNYLLYIYGIYIAIFYIT